jgi:hypothetical protein
MKNIHLLPTEKSNRLYKDGEKLKLDIDSYGVNNHHIYITSDEEIKEGDWYLSYGKTPTLCSKKIFENPKTLKVENEIHQSGHKKIILTTDTDLIADGVQAIDDDEFLQWFVKNPSCEFVKTKLVYDYEEHPELVGNPKEEWSYYKIIIPQEEPKQDKWEQLRGAGLDQPLTSWNDPKKHVELINNNIEEFDKSLIEYKNKKNKFKQDLNDAMHEAHQTGKAMKQEVGKAFYESADKVIVVERQETLEEFIDKVDTPSDFDQFTFDQGIRVGAKWQAERMYSEEEVNEMFDILKRNSIDNIATITNVDLFIDSWKKQFKKK